MSWYPLSVLLFLPLVIFAQGGKVNLDGTSQPEAQVEPKAKTDSGICDDKTTKVLIQSHDRELGKLDLSMRKIDTVAKTEAQLAAEDSPSNQTSPKTLEIKKSRSNKPLDFDLGDCKRLKVRGKKVQFSTCFE